LDWKEDREKVKKFESVEAKIAQNLLKFNALNVCVGCDLSRVNLKEADLSGADLTGATLRNAYIKGAIFCNTKTPWGLDNSGCKK